MPIEIKWCDYDVIVVGSGGAGAHAARAAAGDGARVLVVSKDPIGCSDTKISEGVATVRECGSGQDTEETLAENLRMAGADLPLSSITEAFAKDSKTAYDDYRTQGLRPPIDTERDTPQALPLPMGGHNQRRSVGHDNSGVAFGHASWQAIIGSAGVDYLEDAWFLELVTDGSDGDKRIAGGLIYDAPRGVLVAARAPAVVIAAGGLSTLFFPKTDTMRGNTGDAYAVAMRAGADLVDMEQVQFLPFCLASPPSYEGLLAGEPSSASYLGVLRDKNGKVILDSVYLRTRAECSSAIMRAVADGRGTPNGGAWLDMTENKRLPLSGPWFMRFIETSLPGAYKNARQAMPKPMAACDEPWEVRPSAHYHMGGIRVDANGASTGGPGEGETAGGVHGLFAAGQAMGGLFGANRLGSTSLTEGAVFGARAGHSAARLAAKRTTDEGTAEQPLQSSFDAAIQDITSRFGQVGKRAAYPLKLELQEASWSCIGPVRTRTALDRFGLQLQRWADQLDEITIPAYSVWNQSFIEFIELRNMLDVAGAVSAAASERDCSVGGHVRLDCPNVSPIARPYSTIVQRQPGAVQGRVSIGSFRVARQRTPPMRAVVFRLTARWWRLQATALRHLPAVIQDKILEKRYRAVMGKDSAAPEITPAGPEAAVAEAKHA